MSKLSEKLEKLVESIQEGVIDFTTLDVVTLSGDISLILDGNGKYQKVKDIVKEYGGKSDGKITVEAFTHIDFDQDQVQYFKAGLKESDLTYKLHQQSVESSKVARQAMMNFIKEVIA